MVTDAQKKATLKYESKNYDKVLLRMPKGERDKIKSFIKSICPDESLNEFINKAIDERMERIQKDYDCLSDAKKFYRSEEGREAIKKLTKK